MVFYLRKVIGVTRLLFSREVIKGKSEDFGTEEHQIQVLKTINKKIRSKERLILKYLEK
jgi:hypothetical protein